MLVTETDLAGYLEAGYCVIPNAVGEPELTRLRAETLAQIEAGPDREPASDFICTPLPGGLRGFHRIQSLTEKGEALFTMMANPAILEAVTKIVGQDACCYATAMIFKAGGSPPILPHRDVVDRGPDGFQAGICSIDVALDDSTVDNGCLQVVPGSHLLPDVRELCEMEWNVPGLVPVEVRAGDVLIHNGMIIHGSAATGPDAPMRRVLYPTFQSADKMASEGPYGTPVSADWVARHLKRMVRAVQTRRDAGWLRYERQFPYEVPQGWEAAVDAAPFVLRSG